MKCSIVLYTILSLLCFFSCAPKTEQENKSGNQYRDQLEIISTLLQDSAFAVSIARAQDSAYAVSQKQPIPAFPNQDSMLSKSLKEEKIATNVAAFYAVECAISALIGEKGGTPVQWLKKIVEKKTDSADVLLLNRFANAAWKAGQPFRSLSRIKRDNFIVANFLSAAETKKDYDQVLAAAGLMLDSLKILEGSPKEIQRDKIKLLLQSKQFALEMARHMEAAYYKAGNKTVPQFLSASDDTAMIRKSAFEEKVATNLAGFYGLECGLSYFATRNKNPSALLQSIIENTIDTKDKTLLERFANATWKASQPFRSLDRITRENFIPFPLLSAEEVEKDWVQVQTAATVVKKALDQRKN